MNIREGLINRLTTAASISGRTPTIRDCILISPWLISRQWKKEFKVKK